MKVHDLLLALLLAEERDGLNSKLGINNRDPYSTTNCLKQVNTRKERWVWSPSGKTKGG